MKKHFNKPYFTLQDKITNNMYLKDTYGEDFSNTYILMRDMEYPNIINQDIIHNTEEYYCKYIYNSTPSPL